MSESPSLVYSDQPEDPVAEDQRDRPPELGRLWWSMGGILLLAFLIWLPRLSGPIDLRWDAGVYYVLGTSLATGQGYRLINEPGAPRGVQYPPLLPAIVAAHERVLGSTEPAVVAPALRHSYFVLFLIYAAGALMLARVVLPPLPAFCAAALCLLQLMTFFLSDVLFTELPFGLVGVVFALVALRGVAARRPILRETLLFALAAAGFLLRTAGLALLAAWVLEAVARRQWRLMFVRAALAAVPVLSWQAYVAHVRGSDEYAHPAYAYQRAPYQYYNVSYAENVALVDPFKPELGRIRARDVVSRLATNILEMPQALGESVSEGRNWWNWAIMTAQHKAFGRRVLPGRTPMVPTVGLGLLVVAGIIVLLWRREWLCSGVMVTTIALVCATPWPAQFVRYLSGTCAFLAIAVMVAIVAGHSWLVARFRGRWQVVARCVAPAILAITFVVQAFTVVRAHEMRSTEVASSGFGAAAPPAHFFFFDQAGRSWEQAVEWIEAHSDASAVVATTAPHLCFLKTKRLAILPPFEADPVAARKLMESVPVSHVIVDGLEFLDVSRRYALPAVESAPGNWRVVFSVEKTRVYERVKSAP